MSQGVPHTRALKLGPSVNPNINFDSGSIICQEGKEGRTETPADLLSTLPGEVTSYIFCHPCKPIPGNHKWQRHCYPLLLGRISRQYRQYAWVTSKLWATIVIQVNPPKSAVQTELLEELARMMGRPIDVYFKIETQLSIRNNCPSDLPIGQTFPPLAMYRLPYPLSLVPLLRK